jgi:hypothetical protein
MTLYVPLTDEEAAELRKKWPDSPIDGEPKGGPVDDELVIRKCEGCGIQMVGEKPLPWRCYDCRERLAKDDEFMKYEPDGTAPADQYVPEPGEVWTA